MTGTIHPYKRQESALWDINEELLFDSGDGTNTCVKVVAEEGQAVEIMFETVPTVRLCMKDVAAGVNICEEGQYQNCITAAGTNLVYEFVCSPAQGCSESDVDFWYRITKGPPKAEDTEGMWCQWRNSEYPEGLMSYNPNLTPKPTQPPASGSTGLFLSLTTLIVTLSASL